MLACTRSGHVHRVWVMLALLCFLIRVARPALSLRADLVEAAAAQNHPAFYAGPVHSAAAIGFLDGGISSSVAQSESVLHPICDSARVLPSYGFLGARARELNQLRI